MFKEGGPSAVAVYSRALHSKTQHGQKKIQKLNYNLHLRAKIEFDTILKLFCNIRMVF